jgi:putative ABC transport system substrate-binding protein
MPRCRCSIYRAKASWSSWTAAFESELSKLGWIEGRTVAIEYRWSEGHSERVAEIAAEFVRQKVDLIVAYGGAVTTLKQATAYIPIVFAPAVDPVGVGLVASLSHPGGNVTGLSIQATDAAGKRLQLLRDVVPKRGRLGILFDAGYAAAVQEKGEVQAVARTLGFEVVPQEIRRAEDIASAFDALKGKADALYLTENALIFTNGKTIATLALNAQLPTTCTNADTARAGALMSYGPNFTALFRRAAEIVDKILRGTKPGDIPVEQPTKFELVINLKTAKALGLTVPESLLIRADKVIE